MLRHLSLSLALLAAQPVFAQNAAPVVHTAAQIHQLEAKLMQDAKKSPTGVGVGGLDDFGTYSSHMIVRVHTGEAERHKLWADQIVVDKGTITLVSGGTIVGEHALPAPGESRGTSIEGGKEVVLHPGDIVHIPAGLAHLVKIAPGTTTTYLVFKEK